MCLTLGETTLNLRTSNRDLVHEVRLKKLVPPTESKQQTRVQQRMHQEILLVLLNIVEDLNGRRAGQLFSVALLMEGAIGGLILPTVVNNSRLRETTCHGIQLHRYIVVIYPQITGNTYSVTDVKD